MFSVKNKTFIFSILVFSIFIFAACPAPTTNVNTNANTNLSSNTNRNVNINSAPTNASNTSTSAVETREPDQYQATVKLKFETSGEQKLASPELQAKVARNGADRRMEFKLPNGENLIYLDKGGRQLLIIPQRKQYAELNKESTGFDVRSMMTPSEIVNQIKNQKGVERVGEEKYASRDAIKYQYSAVTDTKTKAGQVETKSFIYVDKQTSLPLHSETNAVSSASYQGVQGLRIVTDLTDIIETADAAMFAEPTDYAKVQPEQVKQQVDTIFSAALAVITQLMKSSQSAPPPTPAP